MTALQVIAAYGLLSYGRIAEMAMRSFFGTYIILIALGQGERDKSKGYYIDAEVLQYVSAVYA